MHKDEQQAAVMAALQCGEAQAHALCSAARFQKLPAGSSLIGQGEVSDRCWMLLDGHVRCEHLTVDGRLTSLATHPPGMLLGPWVGTPAEPQVGALVAVEDCEILTLAAQKTRSLAQADPALAIALAQRFIRQADRLLLQLTARSTLSAAGRVVARLIELADAHGAIRPPPVVSALAIGVQTTRETASRTLSNLERRGIISRSADRWNIRSLRMLEDLLV